LFSTSEFQYIATDMFVGSAFLWSSHCIQAATKLCGTCCGLWLFEY